MTMTRDWDWTLWHLRHHQISWPLGPPWYPMPLLTRHCSQTNKCQIQNACKWMVCSSCFLRERSQHQPPIRLMHSDIGSGVLISCNALWKVLKNSITLLTPFSALKATEYSMPSISSWVSMVASDQLLLLIVTWDCRAMGWQTNRRERCRQTVTFSFGEECKNEEENAISSIDSRYWCIIILFQCRHDIYQAIKNTYYACLPHRVANSQACDTISAWYLGDHWEDYQHTLKSSWLVNLRRSTIKPLKIKQVHGHDIWV